MRGRPSSSKKCISKAFKDVFSELFVFRVMVSKIEMNCMYCSIILSHVVCG